MTDAPRVLYVEDNDDVRELIVELLVDEGLTVTACASAEAALAAFEPDRFDFVVTDVSLPGASGTELAKRLLAQQPGLWIVFASGYSMPISVATWGPRVRALLKPFEVDELTALLAEIRADAICVDPSA